MVSPWVRHNERWNSPEKVDTQLLRSTRGTSVMPSDRTEHVDLLVDGDDDEGLSAALNAGDFCLQWHDIPKGAFRAMREMLSKPSGTHQELGIGKIFGAALYLVEREGVYGFKAIDKRARADLLRVDLPQHILDGMISALDDAIEAWEAAAR